MNRLACFALGAALLGGCDTLEGWLDGRAQRATVSEILSNPSGYLGERVEVSGVIDRTWEAGAFTLAAGAHELLVITPQSAVREGWAGSWSAGQRVEVNGAVVRYGEGMTEADPAVRNVILGFSPTDPVVVAEEIRAEPAVVDEPIPAQIRPVDPAPERRPAPLYREDRAPAPLFRDEEPPLRPLPAPRPPPIRAPREPAPLPAPRDREPPAAPPDPLPVEPDAPSDPADAPPDRGEVPQPERAPPDRVTPPATEPSTRATPAAESAPGRHEVQVERMLDQDVFTVRTREGQRMLVRVDEGARLDLAPGQRLAVEGVTEPLPSPEALREQWDLPEPEVEEAQSHPVYLRVLRVSGATPEPGS